MNLDELIPAESILCNVSARSKKHCLEILSELLTANHPDIANEEVFARLIERERLGCTCLDQGVAFPHCRVSGLSKSSGALLKLAEPVDFDSADGQLVDLVLGLMVPEELGASELADIDMLTGLLRDRGLGARLRAATSSSELGAALFAGQIEPAVKMTGARQA